MVRTGGFVVMTAALVPLYLALWPLPGGGRRAVAGLWFRLALALTGVRLRTVGAPDRTAVLFVANHVSYLDIPILGALLDARFVAKAEVAAWPGFGFLARLGRTVFIERRAIHAASQSDDLTRRLAEGQRLLLFPEGTSSDGRDVRPFKTSLFAMAERLPDLAVQPISLAYRVEPARRDAFAWYGDMELPGHLWRMFGLDGVDVVARFHATTRPCPIPGGRKELARLCQERVARGLMEDMASSDPAPARAVEPPGAKAIPLIFPPHAL